MVFHEERMNANNVETDRSNLQKLVGQRESEINSLKEIIERNESNYVRQLDQARDDNQRLRDQLADAREARPIELTFPEGAIVSVPAPERAWGLTEEQLRILALRMAPYAPSNERDGFITALMNVSESEKFGFDLVTAFREAGWLLPGIGLNRSVLSGYVEGVVIKSGSNDVSNVLGLLDFVKTLREAGIEPVGQFDGSIPSDEFRIIVGHKPTP